MDFYFYKVFNLILQSAKTSKLVYIGNIRWRTLTRVQRVDTFSLMDITPDPTLNNLE